VSHATGLIAAIDDAGALSTVDARTGSRVAYPAPGVAFTFPAWSPDGSRIAAVGQGTDDVGVYVFRVVRGAAAGGAPAVIYRSTDQQPFYLYWTPDSRRVSFLTSETTGLALRVVPIDASPPLDGTDTGSILRRGAPLYFQWVNAKRVLLHVSTGTGAFVGQIGMNGAPIGSPAVATGLFRPATLSHDGRYLAYATSTTGAEGEMVVQATDGATDQRLSAFGPAAMLFDPLGDTLATIAADKPDPDPVTLPRGPLRLIDPASGASRTVLDGSVVAFFWAPDGKTIAAVRVVGSGQGPAADVPPALAVARAPEPQAGAVSASTGSPIDLVFVDVATGAVRSEREVRLADTFVGQLLPYFDQYALSHTLWSPDSTSILLPLVDASGQDQLTIVPADRSSDPVPIADGLSGFWRP
jgi:TolB protein